MDPFFEQLKQNITALVNDGKAKEAYSKAKQLVAQYPEDEDVHDILREVTELIMEENEDLVEKAMPELRKGYEEGRFDYVLQEAGKLLKFAPKNDDLKNLYFKTQKSYAKKLDESLDLVEGRYRKRFEDLLVNSPDLLPDELFDLDMANAGNGEILKLTAEFRDRLIEKLIKEKEELIYSDKTEATLHFLESLERIDPKSKRIEDVRRLMRLGEREVQQEDRLEFMYRGEQHLKTLLRLKKYDMAMKVAEEILAVDPKSGYARRGLNEAKRKLYGVSRAEVVRLVSENQAQLEGRFKDAPGDFISL